MLFPSLFSLLLQSSPNLPPEQICSAAMQVTTASRTYYASTIANRLKVCAQVVKVSQKEGLDGPLAAVLSWEESNWEQDQVHPQTKVAGPLQVAPRWWCPNKTAVGCDLVLYGVRAVNHYMVAHSPNEQLGLCHYNQGVVCVDLRLTVEPLTFWVR